MSNVSLKAGSNNVPIGLQQALVGWFIVRLRGNATVWDSNDGNTNNQILILNSTAAVVVDICVF